MKLCSMLWASLGGRGVCEENRYLYIYGWVPLLFSWNYHNIVNQLSVNVRSSSCVQLFVTPLWTAAQSRESRPPCPSPSPEVCPSSCLIASMMPSSHLILWHPLLLLPSRISSTQYKISFKVKKRKKERGCFQCSQDQRLEGLVSDWLDVLRLPPMSSTQEW